MYTCFKANIWNFAGLKPHWLWVDILASHPLDKFSVVYVGLTTIWDMNMFLLRKNTTLPMKTFVCSQSLAATIVNRSNLTFKRYFFSRM